MTGEEMVRWILSACNPRLASGLQGVLSAVEQLMDMGSLIEKDWSNSKEYWSQMQQSSHTDHTIQRAAKKSQHGWPGQGQADMVAMVAFPSLQGVQVPAEDSGCTRVEAFWSGSQFLRCPVGCSNRGANTRPTVGGLTGSGQTAAAEVFYSLDQGGRQGGHQHHNTYNSED